MHLHTCACVCVHALRLTLVYANDSERACVHACTKSWSLEHLPAAVVCALWVAGSATFLLVVSNTHACSTHTHSQYSIQLNLREKKARLAPRPGFYCRSAASK